MSKLRALVWQQYGGVTVYAAQTPLHFFKIYEAIRAATDNWGTDHVKRAGHLYDLMGKATDPRKCESIFMQFVRPHQDHETFEVFEFVDIQNADGAFKIT